MAALVKQFLLIYPPKGLIVQNDQITNNDNLATETLRYQLVTKANPKHLMGAANLLYPLY